MKKLFTIAFLILVLCSSLFAAATYLSNQVGDIKIYGFINEYVILYVTPIEMNKGSTIGMPFDLTGSDVAYKDPNLHIGREIATWSFATNLENVTLSINATPLVNDISPETEINYYLHFSYTYVGEDSSGNTKEITDYITVPSNSTDVVTNISNYSEYVVGTGLPIISMDNDVRITLFDYPASEKEAWADGFYYGNVTLTLEGQ